MNYYIPSNSSQKPMEELHLKKVRLIVILNFLKFMNIHAFILFLVSFVMLLNVYFLSILRAI